MADLMMPGTLVISDGGSIGVILSEGGRVLLSGDNCSFNYVVKCLASGIVGLVPTDKLTVLDLSDTEKCKVCIGLKTVIGLDGRFQFFSEKFTLSYANDSMVLNFTSSYSLGFKHYVEFVSINGVTVKPDSLSVNIDSITKEVSYSHPALSNSLIIRNGIICLGQENISYDSPREISISINGVLVTVDPVDYLTEEEARRAKELCGYS